MLKKASSFAATIIVSLLLFDGCREIDNKLFNHHSKIALSNQSDSTILACWLQMEYSDRQLYQYHPRFLNSEGLSIDKRCTRLNPQEKKDVMVLGNAIDYGLSFESFLKDVGPQYLVVYSFHWGIYTKEDIIGIYELSYDDMVSIEWELTYPMNENIPNLTLDEYYNHSGITLTDKYIRSPNTDSVYPHKRSALTD